MSKVWFITGSSRGFGRVWTEAALDRGDRVAATARNPEAHDDLVAKYGDAILPIQLDVDDRAADFAAVQQAHERFGRLDVVVNNAGWPQGGFVEELTEEAARAQMETNFFGMLWVAQAALPFLRAQGRGHIIMLSSVAGVYAHPGSGMYSASKWAIEGLSQSLAQEVNPLGIKVTVIEPSHFETDSARAGENSLMRTSVPIPAYDGVRAANAAARAARSYPAGDPDATGAAILAIVDADEPPLRCFFGMAGLGIVTEQFDQRLTTWQEWNHVALLAQGSSAPNGVFSQ